MVDDRGIVIENGEGTIMGINRLGEGILVSNHINNFKIVYREIPMQEVIGF